MTSEPRKPGDLGSSLPLAPPLYQSSVYSLPDLDALERIADGTEGGYVYARDAHPNASMLAADLAAIEGGSWGMICGSGMAAISATLLALLDDNRRIVASNRLYGRTTQLLAQELPRFGVQVDFVDTSDPAEVQAALAADPARILFVETISNPLLRVVDIALLAKMAHARKCLLAVDNTFATPLLTRPLELGADIVIESMTKMLSGHSDVTLGVVCGKGDELPQFTQTMSIWGFASNPFDCWLAQRGLETFPLRMRAACENAAALADWLGKQPGVSRVIYPGLEAHADHELAGRVLQGGFGNMLCFELSGGRDAVNRFMRGAPGVTFSPSLGNTTTTCSHPGSTSHRYVSPAEKKRLDISDGLIRLSIGIEDLEAIQEEMGRGLR